MVSSLRSVCLAQGCRDRHDGLDMSAPRMSSRRREAIVKYVILIHSNPNFLERWQALSDEQRAEFGRRHFAITDELAASGELVASEGLADPALGKWINTGNGETVVMD